MRYKIIISVVAVFAIVIVPYSKVKNNSLDFKSIGSKTKEKKMIDNGLIAYYSFDGNAKDLSGNNNHGKIIGAIPMKDRFGKEEGAFKFNGVDNEVIIPSIPQLGSNYLTISLWAIFDYSGVKSEWKDWVDGGKGFHHPMICQTDLVSIRTFELCMHQKKILWHRMGPFRSCILNQPSKENEWYHILCMYDGKDHSLYVNGALAEKYSGPLYTSKDYRVTIGSIGESWADSSGHLSRGFFCGSLDDIRIYNRILSENEIHELANQK